MLRALFSSADTIFCLALPVMGSGTSEAAKPSESWVGSGSRLPALPAFLPPEGGTVFGETGTD